MPCCGRISETLNGYCWRSQVASAAKREVRVVARGIARNQSPRLGNGHHDQLAAPGGLADGDRGRAGLRGQVGERPGPARVGDEDLVPERGEATGEGAADLA